MKKKYLNKKHNKIKYCIYCGVELNLDNYYSCLRKNSDYACKKCWYEYTEYIKHKKFVERMDETIKNYKWNL